MPITKTESGRWLADLQPGGRGGKRIRRTFDTKREALEWETHIRSQTQQKKDWAPPKADVRRLSTLVQAWYDLHGVHLKRGEKTRQALANLAAMLGDPPAAKINAETFGEFRRKRIAGEIRPETETRKREGGITPNSANRELAYLRALFNELRRLGQWTTENPVAKVRQFRIDERELSFLTLDEIRNLLEALREAEEPDAQLITRVCLACGCRWSEAETLTVGQVHVDRIQLARTKSGRVRTIPVADDLAAELASHISKRLGERPARSARLFHPAYGAFRAAIERACIQLPDGQLTHVLRHSFASHFMQAGGNILTLQRILGHASLQMTMRYAHLAPDHLLEAVSLNPLRLAESAVVDPLTP